MKYSPTKGRALPDSNREQLISEINTGYFTASMPYHCGTGLSGDEYLPKLHPLDVVHETIVDDGDA